MLGNLGWLGGAVVARRVTKRLGVGRTLVLGAALGGAPLLLWPLTPQSVAVPLLVVSTLLVSFGIVLFNIRGISLYQTLVPDRLLGRMNASRRWIVWGVLPLGSLIGGVLASWIGVRTTLFVGAGLSTVAFVF